MATERQINFANTSEAERVLSEAGFAIGTLQRNDPRGVMWGRHILIMKWRNLSQEDIDGLDASLVRLGSGPDSPVRLWLNESAREEAVAAFRKIKETQSLSARNGESSQ